MHRFAITLFVLTLSCVGTFESPRIENGRADLRALSFKSNTTIPLAGGWTFCPGELLQESDFQTPGELNCSIQEIPASWTSYKLPGSRLSGDGIATYRLKILMPADVREAGLYMPYQGTAFDLWINGKYIASNGTVSRDPGKRKAAMEPVVVPLPESSEVHLLVRISNSHDKSGGMWNAPRIGRIESTEDYLHRGLLIDSLMAGMLLLATSFSFVLFALNREDRASLYFGIFALFAMLRQISANSHPVLLIFPNLPFEVYYRFEYLGVLLSPAAFLHSLDHLFPGKINTILLRILTGIFLIFATAVLFLPPASFSHITPTNHLFLLATLIIAGRAIYLGRREQRTTSILMGVGFLALSVFVIHDILVELNLLQSPYLVSLGLLFFLLGHVAALAHGAARATQEQARIGASLRSAEILSNVARSLIGCDSAGTIALNLFQSLKGTFHLERLSIYIPEQQALYSAPFSQSDIKNYTPEISEIKSLYRDCSPQDVDSDLQNWPHPYDLPSSICIPVREGDRLRALIFFQRAGNYPFGSNTREILLSISPYVVLALRNASTVTDLIEANQKSYRNQEFQRIVLSVLSHDLRGPLATGYTLLDHVSRSNEALRGTELDLLRGSIQDALDLLQRLLEWARASASDRSENLQSNVRRSLERVFKDIHFRSEQKGVRLLLDPPAEECLVSIDSNSLEVVVRNIAMNAIKYTAKGGEVRIHTSHQVDTIIIMIDDTGIGMEADRARELLDPSRRLQPRSGTEGEKGAGLGMYLSQLLLTTAGGYITVDTERPVGTRFAVNLPLASAPTIESEQLQLDSSGEQILESDSETALSAEPVRVLHIEDSDLLAKLVERFLDAESFHLDRASDGDQAVQKLQENQYDVILSDIELDGENGAALIQEWKQQNNGQSPKVIALTAHEYETLGEFLANGVFDSYLTKPFTKEGLRKEILKVLAKN
ncbi:MAG: response regulator [Leptospiraceae bacterium]